MRSQEQEMVKRLSCLYNCKKNIEDGIDKIKTIGVSSRSYLNYTDFKLALRYCIKEIREMEWLIRKLVESRKELRQ